MSVGSYLCFSVMVAVSTGYWFLFHANVKKQLKSCSISAGIRLDMRNHHLCVNRKALILIYSA